MSLRDELNQSNLNRTGDVLGHGVNLGDLLTTLIKGATPTEAGVVPAAHIATLAAVPTSVHQVNATAGASTGIKKLLIGVLASITPLPGEAVWGRGTNKIKFNTADAVTATSVLYTTAVDKASSLLRSLEEQDTPAP
jgi:hypothetical protein